VLSCFAEDQLVGEMNLRKLVVCNCLIACYLLSYSIARAQHVSEPGLAQQTVQLQPVSLTDLLDPSGSETAASAEETSPPADPQSQGNGNVNGTGKGAGLAATTYVFPTDRQMGAYWARNVLGPKAFIGATFTASWNTWVHLTPDEWGHRRGWGKRFGVAYLDNSMTQSSLVLLSLAMNQDPMYYRCDCSGAWARTRHAIKMSFMSRNHSGGSVFAPPKIVAPFVGPLVTRNTIYPSRFDSSNAARSGAYYLVGSVAWNMVREFIWNVGT
jgi:hypothetical protein